MTTTYYSDEITNRAGRWLNFAANALDQDRMARIGCLLEQEQRRVRNIRLALEAGLEPVELEHDISVLLGRLRAATGSRWIEAARRIDASLQSSQLELVDRACTPDSFKNLELRNLDFQNRIFGNYKRFYHELAKLSTGSSMRLYDLGSGRGGFYSYLVEQRLVPDSWELCASDVLTQPIAQGKARAQKLGLSVRFEQRDATRLDALKGQVDLFTLQNAAHHFSPGLLAKVMYSAAMTSNQGIAIFDPVRGLGSALITIVGCVLPVVTLVNLHDALLSIRRCYSLAELVLLASVCGLSVQSKFVAPMFNYVLVQRPS